MKNLLTLLLISLTLSCSTEETTSLNSTDENLAETNEKIYNETSYIINGEKYTIKTDITDEQNPLVIKNLQSEIILNHLEKENSVFYFNPEIEDLVIFENIDKYNSFISNKSEVNLLKKKFKSKMISSSSDNIASKSQSSVGPVPGDTPPSVAVYQHNHLNGTSSSYTSLANIGNLTYASVGNDAVSSIEVINAYAGFWEHANFVGKLLIVDSYGYHTIVSDLKDAKFNSFTIYNGASHSSNYCGWLCGSHWNDRISSLKARFNNSRNI